jgi:hypothetical protein
MEPDMLVGQARRWNDLCPGDDELMEVLHAMEAALDADEQALLADGEYTDHE